MSALEAIASRARRPGVRILGIVGPPGVGKSWLTALCVRRLPDYGVRVAGIAPMDGFHLSNRVLADLGRAGRKGAPDTFDADGYAALLARLHTETTDVYAPGYDRALHEPVAASHRIGAAGVVLAEGNYLGLWPKVRAEIDVLVALDATDEELARRLQARHVAHGKRPDVAAHWIRNVDLTNAATVRASVTDSDLALCTCTVQPNCEIGHMGHPTAL